MTVWEADLQTGPSQPLIADAPTPPPGWQDHRAHDSLKLLIYWVFLGQKLRYIGGFSRESPLLVHFHADYTQRNQVNM